MNEAAVLNLLIKFSAAQFRKISVRRLKKALSKPPQSGAVAGYPLVDFKVTLIDGSYHNVDSDEHSFRAAGRKAFRNAMEKARPTLLEPIMDVEVFCPQEVSGDIMGDLNSRRGRVPGMEMRGKQQVIKAQVPLSEMLDYQGRLNSMTQARGSYHMQFSHYDPLPQQSAGKSYRTSPSRRQNQSARGRRVKSSKVK
ncbi:MAG: hypothetical protein WKF73_16405 [Nocardioidaceae bacterium]